MDLQTKRLLLLVVSCCVIGIVFGGVISWTQSNTCLQASNITSQCLTQNPIEKIIQGMGTGLGAGAGAAFGIAWQFNHKS
ncbi:hypothetical protein [Mastigocoleus testarum]|uniref:Uncharacterized protein n=1 Tax=Mastigocoleus testarum BC008 TaxID=371196 RepID=A0A0V7ZD46_9CYAN|nr:hypothetical protein [Mastigocoleus testarum]KST62442.1 hypothetical protein BC008_09750 [Mastigocoleus testarum BC008]